ncbi:MAG TPA: YqzL family protein [Clostridia bacterium]|nr:YqzL family protein [Clostridia bacterium]
MLKEFAWNTFINTGNLESYILYKEIEEKDRAAEQSKLAEAEAAPSVSNA